MESETTSTPVEKSPLQVQRKEVQTRDAASRSKASPARYQLSYFDPKKRTYKSGHCSLLQSTDETHPLCQFIQSTDTRSYVADLNKNGAGIVRWYYVGFVVLFDAASWVRSSSGEMFFSPVKGIFPLELTWVLTPFPQNSFGGEYKPRSSQCTHSFHRTASKDPDIQVLDG